MGIVVVGIVVLGIVITMLTITIASYVQAWRPHPAPDFKQVLSAESDQKRLPAVIRTLQKAFPTTT